MITCPNQSPLFIVWTNQMTLSTELCSQLSVIKCRKRNLFHSLLCLCVEIIRVHFVRAATQQQQSAARPETVHSTHQHHRPYWLSLIFLIFNYQSLTSCTMFVQSPGKYCITTYIITESGRDNRFLPAPPASYPEFVQSHVSHGHLGPGLILPVSW